MYKILKIILMLSIVNTFIWADILQKELDKYMTISIARVMLHSAKSEIFDRIIDMNIILFTDDEVNETIRKKAKEKAIKFISLPRYKNAFIDTFRDLESYMYRDMLSFYKTVVGKKYASGIIIFDPMVASNAEEEEAIMKLKDHINRAKNTLFSEKKLELLDSISEEFHTVELKMKYREEMLNLLRVVFINDDQNYTDENIEKMLIEEEPAIVEYEKRWMRIKYLDFTEDELRKVLAYASSDAGKTEKELIYGATAQFIKMIMIDMNKKVEKTFKERKEKLEKMREE